MAQIADDSLERRILDLEEAVRSLRTSAAVGGTSVGASNPGSTTLTGVAGTAGVVDWTTTPGPYVDLYVAGGRIEVKVAASLEAFGNRSTLYVGYQVRGPIDEEEGVDVPTLLATAPVVVAPDYERAINLQDDGVGMNQVGAYGTFDLVTGLDPGWYRVRTAYALAYSGSTPAPTGTASYRRISVTRY